MPTHRIRHGFNHDHEHGEHDGEPEGRQEDNALSGEPCADASSAVRPTGMTFCYECTPQLISQQEESRTVGRTTQR